jgi:ATP-dependent Lon protease
VKAAPPPRELDASEARFRSDVGALGISSTRDVDPSAAIGDERGGQALGLALEMRSAGYHVFASGVEGPGRLERIEQLVRSMLPREVSLWDWIYVHNFADPLRPRAIRLRAGEGGRLARDLASFLAELREDLPKAFREQTFDVEKARVIESFQERQREDEARLNQLAAKEGFVIRITREGNIVMAPLVDGKLIESAEELQSLGADRMAKLEDARRRLEHEIRAHLERTREERHRLDEEIRSIERDLAKRIAVPRLRSIAARYGDEKLSSHLEEMAEHIAENLEPFRTSASPELPFPLSLGPRPEDALAVYEVNIVVDNSRTRTLPILVVDSPTYKNLFGTVDRVIEAFGRLSTDFRRIQAGALLRADGGVVIVHAEDILVEPFVWRILRRCLRSGRVEIEAYDPFVLFTTSGIRPEPIHVDTKVVLVGSRWLYEMLLIVDEEFADLFKVLADFSPIVERTESSTRALCGRVARLVETEGCLPFAGGALDSLVELGVREAGDRRRIDLGSERVLDAAREANAHARKKGRQAVSRGDVQAAVLARLHRLDRVEQDIRKAIERGQLRIDVDGTRVGQVNALSILELSGRAFGRAGRVSATVGLGARGVVNIEREAKLSGSTHDKGVLILEGFLRERFARGRPLSLVCSLAFEQSYGPVEGDSASLAELLAILSCIGGFPVRQDLAVTGSVDQAGHVQAVGGVSEKVEGFFHCCRAKGLTGRQGVIVPAANVENLVLADEAIDAIESKTFRVLPVATVDEALEALTGLVAGAPDEPDTLYQGVDWALGEMARRLASFGEGARRGEGEKPSA